MQVFFILMILIDELYRFASLIDILLIFDNYVKYLICEKTSLIVIQTLGI